MCCLFFIFQSFLTQSLIQIDRLLSVAFSIKFRQILAAHNRSHLSDPTKHRALSSVHSDLVLQSMSMVRLTHDLLRLGFSKYIHFSPVTIRENREVTFFVPGEQHFASGFSVFLLSFSPCGTHFPIFWNFSMDFKRVETASRVTFN